MNHVLHICNSQMNRGGVETFVMNMYRCIDRDKFQFGFLVKSNIPGDYDEEIHHLGGEIFVSKTNFNYPHILRIVCRFFYVIRVMKANPKYKIAHIHASNSNCIIELIALWIAGCSVRIVHSHSSQASNAVFHKRIRFLVRALSTHRFACSKVAGEWMFGKRFPALKSTRIIHNAVILENFKFDQAKREKIRMENELEGKLVIGHVGRFSNLKNHRFLIEVFAEIAKERPNAILLLIGRGELLDEVKNQASKLGILDKAKFLGVRDDIHELMMAMDCFVLPSLYEGLPVVLVEAQASGLKVFVSDTVSSEAEITDNIEYISLDCSPKKWAKNIIQGLNSPTDRKNYIEQVTKSGYNMCESIKQMERIYDGTY